MKDVAPVVIPNFHLSGSRLRGKSGQVLDLSRRHQAVSVLRYFMKRPFVEIRTKELIHHLYGPEFDLSVRSKRFQKSMKHNVTKMISRLRGDLNRCFNHVNETKVEFFPYNNSRRSWVFFNLSPEFMRRA
jgi:hypothetical protein